MSIEGTRLLFAIKAYFTCSSPRAELVIETLFLPAWRSSSAEHFGESLPSDDAFCGVAYPACAITRWRPSEQKCQKMPTRPSNRLGPKERALIRARLVRSEHIPLPSAHAHLFNQEPQRCELMSMRLIVVEVSSEASNPLFASQV